MKLLMLQSFPAPRLFLLIYVKIFSSAPCSQTPSAFVLPLVREIKFHTRTCLSRSRIFFIHVTTAQNSRTIHWFSRFTAVELVFLKTESNIRNTRCSPVTSWSCRVHKKSAISCRLCSGP